MSQRYCDWCLRLDVSVYCLTTPDGHGVYCSVRCCDAHAESARQDFLWQQARDANAKGARQ